LAYRTACTWDPQGNPPDPTQFFVGCEEFSEGYGTCTALQRFTNAPPARTPRFNYRKIFSITNGKDSVVIRYSFNPDVIQESDLAKSIFSNIQFEPQPGSQCAREFPPPELPPDQFPPQIYNDQTTGCSLKVTLKGFVEDSNSGAAPVFKVESEGKARYIEGSTISGCNFAPTLYYGGGDAPDTPGGPTAPYNPDWDNWDGKGRPPWLDQLEEIVAGAAGKATKDAIEDALETPTAGTEYKLDSICEVDAQGNPIQRSETVEIPTTDPLNAILLRVNGIADLLQPLKDFKQPVCPPEKPQLLGDFRTISFVSDEKSPNGDGRIRKYFRYRSQSGIGLGELVDYWKDFTWQAGPVCVRHIGAAWGTPQVWAASVDEGKRVIRHAAGEAGINPDQAGQWRVSGSNNPRFGMPGTMRVNTKGGYYWITERLGSSARPLVAKTI